MFYSNDGINFYAPKGKTFFNLGTLETEYFDITDCKHNFDEKELTDYILSKGCNNVNVRPFRFSDFTNGIMFFYMHQTNEVVSELRFDMFKKKTNCSPKHSVNDYINDGTINKVFKDSKYIFNLFQEDRNAYDMYYNFAMLKGQLAKFGDMLYVVNRVEPEGLYGFHIKPKNINSQYITAVVDDASNKIPQEVIDLGVKKPSIEDKRSICMQYGNGIFRDGSIVWSKQYNCYCRVLQTIKPVYSNTMNYCVRLFKNDTRRTTGFISISSIEGDLISLSDKILVNKKTDLTNGHVFRNTTTGEFILMFNIETNTVMNVLFSPNGVKYNLLRYYDGLDALINNPEIKLCPTSVEFDVDAHSVKFTERMFGFNSSLHNIDFTVDGETRSTALLIDKFSWE